MVQQTFLQHWIFTKFAFPFLLVFFIVFALLEKTEVFGKDKKQLNAILSFVVGLVFVGAVYPKLVVQNLILFLTVAIIVIFIGLLLWGFITGQEAKVSDSKVKMVLGVVLALVLLGAVLWATGWYSSLFGILTGKITNSFWLNLIFIVVIAAALALVIKNTKSG